MRQSISCFNQNELAHSTCLHWGKLDCFFSTRNSRLPNSISYTYTGQGEEEEDVAWWHATKKQQCTLEYDLGVRRYIPHLPKRNYNHNENNMEHNQHEHENHQWRSRPVSSSASWSCFCPCWTRFQVIGPCISNFLLRWLIWAWRLWVRVPIKSVVCNEAGDGHRRGEEYRHV